ncbi:MAG: SDR family NAD(P)-dependent oxidoreductase [Microbacteriaceae bacterium]
MTIPAKSRVLLTGATGVLGAKIAELLIAKNYSVIFASRNTDAAWSLRKTLVSQYADADISVQEIDLSSLYSVREFAAMAIGRYDRIDGIINNAQLTLLPQRELTADRFEAHLGVNHLGHFALNGLLSSIMPSGSRIVTVSSPLAKYGNIRFHDLRQDHGYTPLKAFGTSKLANFFYASELHQQSLRGNNDLLSVVAHPGNILSEGNTQSATTNPLFKKLGHSAAQGAQVIFEAFDNPSVRGGEFFAPDGFQQLLGAPSIHALPKYARNDKVQQRLWRLSGQLTRIIW